MSKNQGLVEQLATLDPSLPEKFEANTHHAIFSRLRRDAPVHFCEKSAYGPYWSVTRLEDIVRVESDPKTWSSARNVIINDVPEDFAAPAFATMDPPQHRAERLAAAPAVGHARVATLEPLLKARIALILDELPTDCPFDWAERVAAPLTTEIVALLFGWPRADRELLPYWCQVMTTTPAPGALVENEAERQTIIEKFQERLLSEWNIRAADKSRSDIIACLAQSAKTASMIESPERLLGAVSMIAGANEAARGALSGGVLAFHQFPKQWEKLREDPRLLSLVPSEIVRWQSPISHMRRTATKDCILGDQRIRKGEKVILWYCSGNRDESFFPDGAAFSIERPHLKRHVAYGFGIHRCFGRYVAEAELRILWAEILERYDKIEVVAPPLRYRSNFASGYRKLMVRVVPK